MFKIIEASDRSFNFIVHYHRNNPVVLTTKEKGHPSIDNTHSYLVEPACAKSNFSRTIKIYTYCKTTEESFTQKI